METALITLFIFTAMKTCSSAARSIMMMGAAMQSDEGRMCGFHGFMMV